MKNKFILRFLYSLSLTIIFCSQVTGQTSFLSNPNDVTIKSPETSSLLLFNKVPVGSFTGTPTISIPIYKIVGKSINVPISIDYNVNSLQVENHPTCLGMGWSLTAGGSISRIVRRIQDEYLDTRKGFYYNCDNFNGDNWNQYRGVSGENVYIHDCEADIFMFNFLGMSGEFFLDNDKKWKVRSDDNIKVECKIEENLIDPGYVFKSYSTVPTIRNFTLTDKDGNKYFFGGDTTNIEFNMPTFNNGSFAAMSWKLSRIISADKIDTISFNYERGPYTCSISKNKDSTYINILNDTPYPNNYIMDWNESINFFAPLYLKSIRVNGKETIDLDYDISTHYQHSRQDFDAYFLKKSGNTYASIPINYTISYHRNFEIFKRKNISINYPTDMIRELKLTDIIIYNEESRIHQKINFKFNSDTTERLFLEEVDFKGREDNYRSALDYKIFYNNKHLFPKYNNIISDHWGYNNNRPYGMLKNIKYDKSINSFYSKIGVIDSIVLPTGGKNVYTFENHDYGKVLDSLNTINILNKSGIASGLRIKKIDAYYKNQYYGGKEYIYKRNPLFESNPASSGVLQSYPYYFSRLNDKSEENGELIFSAFEMTSSPFIPLSDIAGRHSVTYSEVTEKNIDKSGNAVGYITFKFSNYDNGYNDDREGVLGYNRDFVKYDFVNYRGFERGRVLEEMVYNQDKDLIKKDIYKWTRINPEFYSSNNYHINKFMFYRDRSASFINAISYKLYYYPFRLIEHLSYNYFRNKQDSIVNQIFYKYNIFNQITEEKKIKNNKTEIVITKFPVDYFDWLNSGLISNDINTYTADKYTLVYMINNNIISKPIERSALFIDNNDTIIVKSELFKHDIINGIACLTEYKMVLPSELKRLNTFRPAYFVNDILVNDTSYKTEYQYNYYNNGVIKNYINKSGNITSFIWGYHNRLPIAKIINSNEEVDNFLLTNQLFTSFNTKNLQDYEIDYLHKKLSSYNWQNICEFETFVYDPLCGVTRHINTKGIRKYYFYDYFGRLKYVVDNNKKAKEYYEYGYESGSSVRTFDIFKEDRGVLFTCSIVGSGTITNNSCLLRIGQIVSLYNLFPVTPSQYFEFEGYYVNGVLVSNPKSYYVFDDVKIEARIKEIPVANLLCVILGNGTLSNNSCVLRVGDTVNLITLFQVTPSQYYEFDGYYVNGVLIPNPGNYIVQGDVQIEARTKEILRSEIIVRFGETIISDALLTYNYQTNNESWREGYIIADSKPASTINTTTLSFPFKFSLKITQILPSLKVTIDGNVVYDYIGQTQPDMLIEHEFSEFGPHEIVIEIP